jgi:precorrin-6B C5,15-methyltransferase / cobalt-precorrin-6B C5,C15-methyltransferase
VNADNPALLTVVGVGADGWSGLGGTGRSALSCAEVILGSPRQLELLPATIAAERVPWPSPLLPALPGLLDDHRDRRVCVLASGDPMFHGIGATLARLVGPHNIYVLPHPSSVSLAAARLGWPLADTDVLSLVNTPVAALHPLVNPGRRILVLSAGESTVTEVAALLTARGFDAHLTLLEQIGGPGERVLTGTAADWPHAPSDPLNVVAVECGAGPRTSLVPGLPDGSYDSDGQLTKREVRAVTLAALGPAPGELLWDVGAGAGSIAIEWMRAHRSCRAIAVEAEAGRASAIASNAAKLGVPALRIIHGRAPAALADLPRPDAVFIGGGLTGAGVVDACLHALPAGGRLIANAVTLESEALLYSWYARLGGELTRIEVQRAGPIGGFTGWRPAMPVTLWSVVKR